MDSSGVDFPVVSMPFSLASASGSTFGGTLGSATCMVGVGEAFDDARARKSTKVIASGCFLLGSPVELDFAFVVSSVGLSVRDTGTTEARNWGMDHRRVADTTPDAIEYAPCDHSATAP